MMNSLFGNVDQHAMTLLFVTLSGGLGLSFGRLHFKKISFGISGVLFAGILLASLKIPLSKELLTFCKDFGLSLFVYTIGLQVGPSFFGTARKEGLVLNILAAVVVLAGVLVACAFGSYLGLQKSVIMGVLSGATTNTPSLAAASEALKSLGSEATTQAALGYATAYPIGIVGVIASMIFATRLFQRQKHSLFKKSEVAENFGAVCDLNGVCSVSIAVSNQNAVTSPLSTIPGLAPGSTAITKILRGETLLFPSSTTQLQLADIVHVVGHYDDLKKIQNFLGEGTSVDLTNLKRDVAFRKILVSNVNSVAKSLVQLGLTQKFGATISRVNRVGVDILPDAQYKTRFGDIVYAVAPLEHMPDICSVLGNSLQDLERPHLIPIFFGLALGIVLGSVSFPLPFLSGSFRLGLAGGPLIVAILAGHFSVRGYRLGYINSSSGLMIKELGIILFLAGVGLGTGENFFQTLFSIQGATWLLLASATTLIPMIGCLLLSLLFLKNKSNELLGLLAGSMTDPAALSFAQNLAGSEAPSKSYATVYPFVMILRILSLQIVSLFL